MTESIFTSQTPVTPNALESGGISLGVTFVPAVSGTVTGIRFFAPTTVTGTWRGALYQPTTDDDPEGSGAGTTLSTATLSGSPTPGAWNVIPFSSPVSVTAGVPYRAVYHNTEGHYVSTGSFAAFVSGGLTNGNLTAPANGVNSGGLGSLWQGTYRTGAAIAYPSNSFSQGNYFADVVFEAEAVAAGEADFPFVVAINAVGSAPSAGEGTAGWGLGLSLAASGLAQAPRRIAPSEGSRLVYALGTDLKRSLLGRPNTAVTIYSAETGSTLADIETIAGAAIPGSVLTTDQWSQLPLFRMPPGADTVYAQVLPDGPRWPVYAREDDRLDELESDVVQLQDAIAGLPDYGPDIAALQNDFADLGAEVSDVQGDLDALSVEVDYLGGDVAALEAADVALDARLDIAEADINSLETAVALRSLITRTSPGIVVNPSGDATGVTDLANLNAAAAQAVTAGLPLLLTKGTYYINAAWVLPQRITVHGVALTEEWISVGAGMLNQNRPGFSSTVLGPLAGYPFSGSVITQVTAGLNVIEGSVAASTHDLRNIVVTWATLNSNTGHGFVFESATSVSGSPDLGSFGSFYEKLIVWGHDGNHYGFSWTNALYCTSSHLRAYGGGGYRIRGQSSRVASGNFTQINPYVYILNAGTANGVQLERMGSGEAGSLTHMVWLRPQVNCGSGSTTQLGWNDLGGTYAPTSSVVYGLDLEDVGGNTFAPGTDVVGGTFVESSKGGVQGRHYGPYFNTMYGRNALGAATTSPTNAAFGYRALASLVTNGQSTAFGFEAGRDTTSAGNTFVGYIAGQVNTTGAGLTALGRGALAANLTNSNSTAIGTDALRVATASSNTALGSFALSTLTTGGSNTVIGATAMQAALTAAGNVVIGQAAGYATTAAAVTANATVAGARNTFIGSNSGVGSAGDRSRAIAIGYAATIDGDYAVAIGYAAVASAAGAVAIGVDSGGAAATASVANQIVLGTANHRLRIPGLPTSNPAVAGVLWNNAGVVTVSAG